MISLISISNLGLGDNFYFYGEDNKVDYKISEVVQFKYVSVPTKYSNLSTGEVVEIESNLLICKI